MALVEPALRAGVLLSLFVAAGVIWWVDRPRGTWLGTVRQRLLLGVPWGTLVSALIVLGVYIVFQGGADNWHDPLTLPYFSWSYFYPLGMLLAPFSHMGPGHLTGNLIGTLFLGPVAEYAWGHYPVRRGETTFASWRTNPYVRAFVMFPLGVIGVGVLTSLLHWGPVVGFSGVVYAFAGFAIVRFPVLTLIAVLLDRFGDLLYDTLRDPVLQAEASTGFNTPWFVDIAVQGHLVGFLLGAVLGAALVLYRADAQRPSGIRVAIGTVIFGTLLSPLWALWWIRGPDSYVLHRGAGVLLLVTLGVLLAAAVRASDREFAMGVSWRTVAVLLLVLPIVTMGVVAIPINATAVDGPPPANGSVTVRDYTVTYVEGVTRPQTQVIDLEFLGESAQVETGGVIVTSAEREVWHRVISPGKLAFSTYELVTVGGVGWRREVHVRRQGWSLLKGGSVYRVSLRPPDGDFRPVFTSPPATAGVTLAGRNVSISAATGTFDFVVRRGNTTLGRVGVPPPESTARAGGIRFVRQEKTVYAVVNETRVPIASSDSED